MRWIFRLLGVAVGLVVLLLLAVAFMPKDDIIRLATSEIEASTGRQIDISGPIRPQFFPDIGVSAGGISLGNAEWSENQSMVSASHASIALDLAPLLSGEIQIKSVIVHEAEILLEVAEDGQPNWEFVGAAGNGNPESGGGGGTKPKGDTPAGPAGAVLPDFSLEKLAITNARVNFVDHGSGQRFELEALNAETFLEDAYSPIAVSLNGRLNGSNLGGTVSVSSLSDVISGGQIDLDTELSLSGNTVDFTGVVTPAPFDLGGDLTLDLPSHATLAETLGQTAPDLPEGLGAKRVRASGELSVSGDGTINLKGATIDLDHNTLTGNLSLITADRPHLTANLTSEFLDLSALTGEDTPKKAGGSAKTKAAAVQEPQGTPVETGWSKEPIDASGLGALDADVTLRAGGLDLGTTKTGRARITATLRGGRLVTNIERLDTFGGSVAGQFVVNSRGGLSVRGDLKAQSVALQSLFDEFLDFDRLVGNGTVSVEFLGSGNSLDALMRSLNGNGSIDFGQGELLGVDLVGMLRTLDLKHQGTGSKTVYDAITASFTIQNGVVNNLDLSFLAPLLTALGQGTLDLGGQSLNYRFTPQLLRGDAKKEGVKVPIEISGPWTNIRFRPDLAALAEQELEGEKAKLEADAKKKLRREQRKLKRKAKKELGVDPSGDVEDGITKKLTEELGSELQKLFD
ncbi:MAG: AsmA family protein [Pseudomonadota bacterium]